MPHTPLTTRALHAQVKALTPTFGRYAALEGKLEGELRFAHSRAVDYSEEIALLQGQEREKNVIERT